MITVRRLRQLIEQVPLDAKLYAYEGEDVGIAIRYADGRMLWIRARESDTEDTYVSGPD